MIRNFRIWRAHRDLARRVNKWLRSVECESYRRHRAAALKGLGR